jgi:hypothetical protein
LISIKSMQPAGARDMMGGAFQSHGVQEGKMRCMAYLLAGSVGVLVAVSAVAAGPYDGTYVGTSMSLTGTTGNSGKGAGCQTAATAPGPLTIVNGHAQTKWGDGLLEGDVDAGGKLVMHSHLAGRFEGQVSNGAVRGNYQGYCIFALAWQKR